MLNDLARQIGFSQIGVLSGETVLEGQPLLSWLADGCQADMHWMGRNPHKRLSPLRLLKAAPKNPQDYSLICVTLPYLQPGGRHANTARYKIARYAMGQDYHTVLRQRLYQLLQVLQDQVPERKLYGRAFVDSAPILEKPLAALAGLGWQGKHTNLIHPQQGSFQFVGTLLVDIPFEALSPLNPSPFRGEGGHLSKTDDRQRVIATLCGTCTRCIDACPTKAIVPVGNTWRVDARRCIAYWTIENHDEQIPEPIASNLQGWVFGCDICQEVCPWNLKFGLETDDPAFQPRPEVLALQQEGLTAIQEAEFVDQFAESPLLRTGLEGLKRNLLAALPPTP